MDKDTSECCQFWHRPMLWASRAMGFYGLLILCMGYTQRAGYIKWTDHPLVRHKILSMKGKI